MRSHLNLRTLPPLLGPRDYLEAPPFVIGNRVKERRRVVEKRLVAENGGVDFVFSNNVHLDADAEFLHMSSDAVIDKVIDAQECGDADIREPMTGGLPTALQIPAF